MNNRLTSIIIGLIIIAGVFSLVYFTKKPFALPTPETTSEKTINNTATTSTEKKASTTETTTSVKPTPKPVTTAPIETPKPTTVLPVETPKQSGITLQDILILCGMDGSSAYNRQHGGSSKPARILGGFKIGVFAN